MADPNRQTTLSTSDLAKQYQVSSAAVEAVIRAVRAGGGGQAQFSHPDLGGMGQWAGGNMIMIGDIFNHGLKERVAKLCQAIARHLDDFSEDGERSGASKGAGEIPSKNWWPADLGVPSAAGAQNNMRYACFPSIHRLAIQRDGRLTIYDTGAYRLNGFSQLQSSEQSLTFSSQNGPVHVEAFHVVLSGRDLHDLRIPDHA